MKKSYGVCGLAEQVLRERAGMGKRLRNGLITV
jgi:hypothetical protein